MSPNNHVFVEESPTLVFRANASTTVSRLVGLGFPNVVYDLSRVEVMSRSYADQLHKEILFASKSGINIQLENMCLQVKDVMEVVAHTQHNRPKLTTQYQERNFSFETINDFYKLLEGKMSLN
jgi:anti-anti-sigma regulatory factor